MKVLFLCHRLPFPPKRGGKIRPFNIIKHFWESGHSVTVGTLARSIDEVREGEGLKEFCDKLIVGRITPVAANVQMVARLPTTIPSSIGYFFSGSLHHRIRTEVKGGRFDLVFVHCSSAAQYAAHVADVPSVLDFGDIDSQKWLDYSKYRKFPLSAGFWLEGRKLRREEKRLAGAFDLCTCTTAAELEILRSFGVAKRADWFPNGVDADHFSPSTEPYDPDQICFVGRMDYFPNQQAVLNFCGDVLPKIRRCRAGAKLLIVGAEPSSDIRKLGEERGITVTGTVDDVRPYVRRSALTVAPLTIARGTQNKILESMAMGVPVVCSTKASGGVDAEHPKHFLVADSDDAFADSILRILASPEIRARLAESARNRVRTHHAWPASMDRLDQILRHELS